MHYHIFKNRIKKFVSVWISKLTSSDSRLDISIFYLFDLYYDLSVLHVDPQTGIARGKEVRYVILQGLQGALCKTAFQIHFR